MCYDVYIFDEYGKIHSICVYTDENLRRRIEFHRVCNLSPTRDMSIETNKVKQKKKNPKIPKY